MFAFSFFFFRGKKFWRNRWWHKLRWVHCKCMQSLWAYFKIGEDGIFVKKIVLQIAIAVKSISVHLRFNTHMNQQRWRRRRWRQNKVVRSLWLAPPFWLKINSRTIKAAVDNTPSTHWMVGITMRANRRTNQQTKREKNTEKDAGIFSTTLMDNFSYIIIG